MRITEMSTAGRDWTADWEGGHRLKAYRDVAGVWTIGAGITRYNDNRTGRVREGDMLPDVATAKALFSKRMKFYEASTDNVTRDDVSQAEFDALCDFCFNVGPEALKRSTLIRLVNNGDNSPLRIKDEFLKWNWAGGRRVRGLWRRRRAEAYVYAEGLYYGPDAHEIDPPK